MQEQQQQQQQQQQPQQPLQIASQEPQVLYGIPLDGIDEETIKLVEKVMRIATTILCVYIIGLIIDWVVGTISFLEMAFNFLIACIIPMCGYYGAKDRNMTLLNFFTASNACCACWQIVVLFGQYAYISMYQEHCKECVKILSGDVGTVNATMGYSCDQYKKDSSCDEAGSFVWATFSCIMYVCLYAYACKLSQELSTRPVFVQHIHRNNNVNTVVMHQQPGTIVQARVVSVGAPMQAQQVTYQANSLQPQMVVSQPRAGPSAIYQAHGSTPNTQVKV